MCPKRRRALGAVFVVVAGRVLGVEVQLEVAKMVGFRGLSAGFDIEVGSVFLVGIREAARRASRRSRRGRRRIRAPCRARDSRLLGDSFLRLSKPPPDVSRENYSERSWAWERHWNSRSLRGLATCRGPGRDRHV